jgi:hypothetical protein
MMQRSFKRQLRAWTVGWLILTVGAVLLGTLSILKEQEILHFLFFLQHWKNAQLPKTGKIGKRR